MKKIQTLNQELAQVELIKILLLHCFPFKKRHMLIHIPYQLFSMYTIDKVNELYHDLMTT